MIDISAEHTNPALAKALAETTAQVFIEQKEAQQQARYAASLTDLETQVDALEAEIMQTRGQIATLGDEADLGPTGKVELAHLQTQLSNDQTRLSVMLQSTEQFRLAMARYGDYISVFSPAELPTDPVSPQPLRNIALAVVVGGMIGVGTAFLLDYLDDTVHTPEDAREALGVNVLGSVPDVGEDEAIGWLAQAQPLSPAAEAFRNLRTSLQYLSLDAPITTLAVTSTQPDEGKSFHHQQPGDDLRAGGQQGAADGVRPAARLPPSPLRRGRAVRGWRRRSRRSARPRSGRPTRRSMRRWGTCKPRRSRGSTC